MASPPLPPEDSTLVTDLVQGPHKYPQATCKMATGSTELCGRWGGCVQRLPLLSPQWCHAHPALQWGWSAVEGFEWALCLMNSFTQIEQIWHACGCVPYSLMQVYIRSTSSVINGVTLATNEGRIGPCSTSNSRQAVKVTFCLSHLSSRAIHKLGDNRHSATYIICRAWSLSVWPMTDPLGIHT